jgi:glycosyltransferase involved in cell wall biosynthesis
VGGIPEVVKENYGVLIEPGDTDALAGALAKIIKKEVSFDTYGMRQYAVDSFSYEGVGKKFYDLYQQVLGK